MIFMFDQIISGIQTTDATPLVTSIFNVPPSSTAMLETTIVAVAPATGISATWHLAGSVKRVVSGAATQIGAVVPLLAPKDAGVTWTATLGPSGNTFALTLTGAVGITINWSVHVTGAVTSYQ